MIKFMDRGIADVTGGATGAREEIPTTGGTEGLGTSSESTD
jgi:hypothetical protein